LLAGNLAGHLAQRVFTTPAPALPGALTTPPANRSVSALVNRMDMEMPLLDLLSASCSDFSFSGYSVTSLEKKKFCK